MNLSSAEDSDPQTINRREAIKRATLLLGVAISPSILAGIMRAQPAAANARPATVHFNKLQSASVAAAAERILPRTDTPGAGDVGVPAFIDLMYGRFMTEQEKSMFDSGLQGLEALSRRKHQRDFAQLTPAQQDDVLKGMAEASQAQEKSFFHQLKELTIVGYFTSEPIGKKVLHYDPIPGPYQACIPLSEVGNTSWTR
jgi:gluconate 2-dehydrogenase gamma chain